MSASDPAQRVADNNGNGDQGESKRAAVGDSSPQACPSARTKGPPPRRGVQVEVVVEDADKYGEFIGKATGAQSYFRTKDPNGKVWHEALDVDNITLLLEEFGTTMYHGEQVPHVRLHLTMDDPTGTAEKLKKAGAKTFNECELQFWGAKWGVFQDPYGVIWSVSNSTETIEDVPKELERKIIPYLMVKDATSYLTFLSEVFGAEIVMPPAKAPDGKIVCAEMRLNGGVVLIGDQCSEGIQTQDQILICYQVPAGQAIKVSKAFEANGGETQEPPTKHSWGEVSGRSKDVAGLCWGICEPPTGPQPTNEEMEQDIRISEKHQWKWSWVVEDVPPIHCFGEVRECLAKHDTLAAAMGDMIPKAYAAAGGKGIPPAGPTVSAYFTWDSNEDGKTRFTCGPTVAVDSPEPEGDGLGVRKIAGCKCAVTVHTGPYSELMNAYMATFDWIQAKGFENRLPCIEIYENSPEDTEPSKLRTKICIPVVPKAAA